jgi:GNAT superfamily N-acetyltransferase
VRARTAAVRRGTRADADTLAWIETEARSAYFRHGPGTADTTPRPSREHVDTWRRRLMARPPATVLVAEIAGEVVGTVAAAQGEEPRVLEIEQFWVLPHLWSRGIGRLLQERLVAPARPHNCRQLTAWVWDINPRGVRFHRRAGWLADGRWRNGPANSQFLGMVLPLPDPSDGELLRSGPPSADDQRLSPR